MSWEPGHRGTGVTYNAQYRRNRTLALKRDRWRCQMQLERLRPAGPQHRDRNHPRAVRSTP